MYYLTTYLLARLSFRLASILTFWGSGSAQRTGAWGAVILVAWGTAPVQVLHQLSGRGSVSLCTLHVLTSTLYLNLSCCLGEVVSDGVRSCYGI